MGEFLRHFEVEGKYKGAKNANRVHVREEMQAPRRYVFCCPDCMEIWARSYITNYDLARLVTTTAILSIPCAKHPEKFSLTCVPGSVWVSWDHTYTEEIPSELLAEEFLLLDYYMGKS